MDQAQALAIVRSLANGVDPESGEVFAPDSAYQRPQVVRALYQAAAALERIERFERRRSQMPQKTGEPWTEDAPYQLTVALQPPEGAEDDLVAWYREEHIRMLLDVPGWRRARLFEQVEGNGPRFAALHELESPAVFETEQYRAAVSTPWRNRLIGSVTHRERYLFELLRTFPRPAWGKR